MAGILSKIKSYFSGKKTSGIEKIYDVGMIEHSSEVVGYSNREVQHKTYAKIKSIIPTETSILDFGCGRGDFYNWHKIYFDKESINYTGVDFNNLLIDAGNKLYADIKLINKDWNSLSSNIKRDWCININSNNFKYTNDEVTNKQLFKTIDKMYKHANKGLILVLASELVKTESEWIKYNPGEILNWARDKYHNVALDHSSFENSFILVIYKNIK